jgi:aflatoxin B1 aldehyde reductase
VNISSVGAPQLMFGCGGLGCEFVGMDTVTDLLRMLKDGGVNRLDTAALYPPIDIGASQRLLGQVGASGLGFKFDTKVIISISGPKRTLEPEKIEKSVKESHDTLKSGDGQRINVSTSSTLMPLMSLLRRRTRLPGLMHTIERASLTR